MSDTESWKNPRAWVVEALENCRLFYGDKMSSFHPLLALPNRLISFALIRDFQEQFNNLLIELLPGLLF
jgi:hypothetical protein